MDFQGFIKEIKKLGYGVGSFNTYDLNEVNHFYLMISQKGESGQFFKFEGEVESLDIILSKVYIILHKEVNSF